MDEPIHSSSWTGPPPEPSVRLLLAAESARGTSSRLTIETIPLELRPQRRAAAYLLFSPVILWLSWAVVHLVSPEPLWADQSLTLLTPTVLVICAAFHELQSPSVRCLRLRRYLMFGIIVAVAGCAVIYGYAALKGYREAVPGVPERAYEIRVGRSKMPDYFVHQRADGTTVEGTSWGPVPYSSTCVQVERLQAPNGFVWIRVLDRSPPPTHEIPWPIRPEDCFGNKPLAALHA